MDIQCVKCGEPWEIDSLHDAADEYGDTFDDRRRAFYRDGCEALGSQHGGGAGSGILAAIIYELNGSDIDGAASDLDTARAAGLL